MFLKIILAGWRRGKIKAVKVIRNPVDDDGLVLMVDEVHIG
jgi:hypothetical protein